jgi:ABC-type sugar transport system ATPase subunit
MASVTYEGVVKRFGDVTAVRDFSLQVDDGEFVVFVGPSGSGKTTALRLLAGLEGLTDGHILIGDRRVDRMPPRDRDIAMVFQDYALYPQMSVRDNLGFGLRMRKTPKEEVRRRVDQGAAMLALQDYLARRPGQLSGGQRQRVAVGRALVRAPQVFLMDEPLSNLDAKLRMQTRTEIKRLHHQIRTTTIFVTHDQVEAMTMGDRVVVMDGGRIEQVGTPREVYEQPANAFVAGFIGSPAMTLATYRHDRGEQPALARGGVRIPARGAGDLSDEVLVGVRPEHTRPWREGDGLIGPFEGVAEYVEMLGRESFVGVVSGDDTRHVVGFEGVAGVEIGDAVRFGIRPGCVHLFDPESGRAIGTL